MRNAVLVLVAVAAIGCVTLTPGPTPPQTASPVPTMPTPAPTPSRAPEPTPTPETIPTPTATAPPAGTPDPNVTPEPTVIDLLPFLTSEVTVVNLTEVRVSLKVTLLDPESSDEFELGVFDVEPLQVTTQSIVPTRFRLVFDYAGGPGVEARTCTIDVAEDEQVQFAVLETGIAITTSAGEPEDGAEMVVATSSRCHAGGGA